MQIQFFPNIYDLYLVESTDAEPSDINIWQCIKNTTKEENQE
jgi:hypothetical protein